MCDQTRHTVARTVNPARHRGVECLAVGILALVRAEWATTTRREAAVPKHRRPIPAAGVDFRMPPGPVQLTVRATSCLLGLVVLTIAINTATGSGGALVDPTASSNTTPASGIERAELPSIVPPSPLPSATESSSDPKQIEDTSNDATEDPADTANPTPVEPSPTVRPGHGRPTEPPGKDK